MKTATKKTKVIEKLIKWGNSPKDVEAMVAEHFEYAAGTYSSVTSIAECLRTIY